MMAADSGSPVGRSAGYDSTAVGDGDGVGEGDGLGEGEGGDGLGDEVAAVGLGDGEGAWPGEQAPSNTRHETTATTRMATPFPREWGDPANQDVQSEDSLCKLWTKVYPGQAPGKSVSGGP